MEVIKNRVMKHKHNTPIGIVFEENGVSYTLEKVEIDLKQIYRKDLDCAGKLYHQLKSTFRCHHCGKNTTRSVLYVYHKVIKRDFPYVQCDSCVKENCRHAGQLLAKKRWENSVLVYVKDKLEGFEVFWNSEKNNIPLEKILLRDVTAKKSKYYYTKFHLFCYSCASECERSLRTVLNNQYNTGKAWVICDECKSRARVSKAEILFLLISEYCLQVHGLIYKFQYEMEGLVSKDGFQLYIDFSFLKEMETIPLILLEIQGGFHKIRHFAETEEEFQTRIERDDIKREFCHSNTLELIEVDYHFPTKKELARLQSVLTEILKEYQLIPIDSNIPDFSEYANYVTLEYQKLNSNAITIHQLVHFVVEGRIGNQDTKIDLIEQLYQSDKKIKTAYNRAVLPEIVHLLKKTKHCINEISTITKVPVSVILRINKGDAYSELTGASKEKPLRVLKNIRIDDKTKVKIVKHLKEKKRSVREISKIVGVSESVVRKINDGTRYNEYSGASKGNPVRESNRQTKEQVIKIAHLLATTNMKQHEIADELGVTVSNVQKINTGYRHSSITGASRENPIRK